MIVTGRGTSGSFAIRGVQLGAAIGATVEANATKPKGYDLAIVVKRCPSDLLHRLRQAGVPIVWDVVDGWPQPHGNLWDRGQCLAWLRGKVAEFNPVGLVAATRAMADDCAEFGLPALWLVHHARPGQKRNPLREKVRTVGYEGGEAYLGRWRGVLEQECKQRGWSFVVNPPALADLDIVVALREADGYAARKFKSNVKLANAQGSGTPSIVNREAGYLETCCPEQHFADTDAELHAALDALTPLDARRAQVAQYRAPLLEDVAEKYRAWLLSKF